MPVLDAQSPLEDGVTADSPSNSSGKPGDEQTGQGNASDTTNDDGKMLRLAKASDRAADTFAQQNWLAQWDRNYKAFRNEHFAGSKYGSDEYKHRSRLFRPKTHSAVTKDLAATAASLFATIDTVTCSPGDETDPMQVANSDVMQELVNYRLDRTSGKNSIPWFLTSMGARQDAFITGICCSKQYWDYQERTRTQHFIETDETTGEENTKPATSSEITKDKPCIDLVPPENVGLHPAAHWMDPVNDGAFFNAWYPMTVGEIRAMMDNPRFPWREVTDAAILKSRVQQFTTGQVRRAREGGKDRYNDQPASVNEFDVAWVCERFIRIEGEDFCFWTLSDQAILSDPVPTEEAYPAFAGERPYVLGFGALEAHRIVPQSNVEIVQPLQAEINDTVNLRLDNVKDALRPLTLVKRGKKVDLDRLKRRGTNTTVLVDDPEGDIKFDRPTDVSASSYTEMSRLDVDFDDLVGVFNSGSVQSNRSLNETVGGMQILSGAANSVTEFQVRIWVETWVERVLAQLAKLEAYYESDPKILAIAGSRAKMFQKYGTNQITDEMLENEVYVRVSAGVGSPDPMQKLAKLQQAITAFTPIAQSSPDFKMGAIKPNVEEFANEIFGTAGVRDAFNRLFIVGQPMPPPQHGMNPMEIQADQADHAADRQNKLAIEQLKAKTLITRDLIGHRAKQAAQHHDTKHDGRHKFVDVLSDILHHQNGGAGGTSSGQSNAPGESINFKDLPPEGKVQMAAQAGIKIGLPPPTPAPAPKVRPTLSGQPQQSQQPQPLARPMPSQQQP